MPYNVRRYEDALRTAEGKLPYRAPITVEDNQVDNTSTSLNLVGEFFQQYSQFIFENYIWIIENFGGINPPPNAVKGQMWYRTYADTTPGELYIYNFPSREDLENGVPPSANGDSTNPDNWLSITAALAGNIEEHITDMDNPHLVSRDDVGLPNVTSGMGGSYNRALNLAGVRSIARTNLDIYSTSEVYTRTETNALLVPIGSTSFNADTLNGEHHDVFVKKAAPVITDSISITPNSVPDTTGNFRVMAGDDGFTDIVLDTDGQLSIGVGANDINVIPNSGTQIIYATDQRPPEWAAIHYDTLPTVTGFQKLNTTNLYMNNDQVYHQAFPPTPTDIGGLQQGTTAVNTLLLDGAADSSNSNIPGSIVRRSAAGTIAATGLVMTRNNLDTPNTDTDYMVKEGDDFFRDASTVEMRRWLLDGANEALMEKATGVFRPSGSFTVATTTNSVVTKIGTGRYRVTFTTPFPNSNYVVMFGEADTGSVTGWSDNDGALNVIQLFASSYTSSSVTINIKRIRNKRQGWPDDPRYNYSTGYYGQYTDTSVRISYAIYRN